MSHKIFLLYQKKIGRTMKRQMNFLKHMKRWQTGKNKGAPAKCASKKARGRRAFKNGENLFEDYGGAVVVRIEIVKLPVGFPPREKAAHVLREGGQIAFGRDGEQRRAGAADAHAESAVAFGGLAHRVGGMGRTSEARSCFFRDSVTRSSSP